MGRFSEARQQYEQIVTDIGDHLSSVDMAILGTKRFHNLAGVCWILEDYSAAKQFWLKALECEPTFLVSAEALFDSAIRAGDTLTAKRMVEHVRREIGPCEEWSKMGAKYFETLGGAGESERFLREAVRLNPYAWGPRIVLSRLLLLGGREAEAQEHLEMLELLGNAEGAFYLGISATRRGDLRTAFTWMERAHELNPVHEETMKQMWNLQVALGVGREALGTGETGAIVEVEGDPFADIVALSHMTPVVHPLVYGRDASNPYYDFLFRLVERYKPKLVVELGTCTGGSTSYLAAGCAETRVISVDIQQNPLVAQRHSCFPNVELWQCDTKDPGFKARLEKEGPINILFIDTEHTYQQANAEFDSLSPLVRSGGLILLDDIRMNGVKVFWKRLKEPKKELNHLHWSGFGTIRIIRV
jgi:tetratricopeptide (TPR) repeat protein